MNDNDDNNKGNEDQPLLQPYQGITVENDGDDVPLDTLADSIRFIIKRDSEMALHLNAPPSPWKLDSIVRSPMLSSPHLMHIPDLQKRRNTQVEKYKLQQKQKKEERKQRRIMRERLESLDQTKTNVDYKNDHGEEHVTLRDEDEQWERKRKAKLQQVMEKSTSNQSFASSSGYSTTDKSTASYSPTADMLYELKKEFEKTQNPTSVSIMYGIINTVIVLPVLMSFGSIIYHDEFFRPYLPVLVKLTVVSGVVHQLSFSTFSTLPFAVGQVQDAGLIFLSTIASNIVKYCKDDGRDDEEILATILIGLSLFTTILGVALVIIGRLKLASYVEYLPTPVVGGYLAFIGFFCGQGGMSLMSNVQVSGVLEWYKFAHVQEIIWSLPGILGGIGIYVSMRTIKHMAVLPCAVTSIVVIFYITLGVTGTSLYDAKTLGWVNQADDPPVWYHTWDYIQFDKVVWSALPGQMITVFSMIVVVALSSSLDIAAIDLEIAKPLEYNYELRMIGLSNMLSGITGGYTGSYIFSQSIFSLRAGIRSRLMGYVIALCEGITIVLPISILSYVPNFVFGSLLMMICVDLMVEWLWDVRKKLSKSEYFIALATFVLIQFLSVEYGILGGVILHFILLKLGFNVNSSRDEKIQGEIPAEFAEVTHIDIITIDHSPKKQDQNIFSDQVENGFYHTSPIMI